MNKLKVKLVRHSSHVWYDIIPLPYEFNVTTCRNTRYYQIIDGIYCDKFIEVNDCFLDEDEKIEESPAKQSNGKLFYELDWEFIEGIAKRMELNKANGKYERFSWKTNELNIPDFHQALIRHLVEILKGNNSDEQENGHLYALCCNSMMIINQLNKNKVGK